MAYPEDPDFTPLHQLAAGVVADPQSRKLYAEAETLGVTVTSISGNASGKTIDAACEALVVAKAAAQLSGDNTSVVEAAIVGLNAAALMWEGMRPGPDWKAYLDGLEAELTTANDAVAAAAQAWDDAETEAEDAKAKEDYGTAAKAQKAAHGALVAAVQDRQAADEAYEDLRARSATAMADGIVGVAGDHSGGAVFTRPGDDNPGAPDQTLRGVAPTGTPSAPTGTPASPGTTTPPAATNPGETPTETEDPNKLTAADLAALSTLAQTTPAATTPAATTPAAATPQPTATDKKPEENGKPGAPISLEDLVEEGILPATGLGAVGLSGVSNPSAVSPRRAVAPAAPSPIPVAIEVPTPATTGNSLSGMRTASDVSGSATPANTAFSPPAAETKTSSATGNQTAANQAGTRPAGHPMGGLPMGGVPMGAAGAPGGGKPATGENAKPAVTRYQPEAGGDAMNDAVRGGTIAQRRDKDADNGK